jgi:hypothetical protein
MSATAIRVALVGVLLALVGLFCAGHFLPSAQSSRPPRTTPVSVPDEESGLVLTVTSVRREGEEVVVPFALTKLDPRSKVWVPGPDEVLVALRFYDAAGDPLPDTGRLRDPVPIPGAGAGGPAACEGAYLTALAERVRSLFPQAVTPQATAAAAVPERARFVVLMVVGGSHFTPYISSPPIPLPSADE